MGESPPPCFKGKHLSLEVVDWSGPIVEIRFNRPIESEEDVDGLVHEAREFMATHVRPKAEKAFFMTCYDNLHVSRDHVRSLQDKMVTFNEEFSRGDVRWGGSSAAQMLVISTSIRSARGSNLYREREQALASLREQLRLQGGGRKA